MSSHSDGASVTAEGSSKTPGDAANAQASSTAVPTPSNLNRATDSPDLEPPLVICEQEVTVESEEATPAAPADAEYVCFSSSDGQYHLQELSKELMSLNHEGGKTFRSPASGDEAPSAFPRKRSREDKKRKGKRKKSKAEAQTPQTEGTDDPNVEIDRFIEDTAETNNMTVQNVKNIIRVRLNSLNVASFTL